MASPFKAFRKNQKLLMAVITILAMFAFLFFGPWSNLGGPTQAINNPEVLTWKYGKITQADLDQAVMLRRAVNSLLLALAQEVNTPSAEMRARSLTAVTPQLVIESMLFAKKAEQMGIIATDAEVNSFLEAWTEGKISNPQLAQLIRRIPLGQHRTLTQHELFETLREQLQASYGQRMFFPVLMRSDGRNLSFGGDPPADRWHYYCQLNKKATVQIFPVAVADFVSEISDPSDSVLENFYDEYKNQVPFPESPVPGFRRPFKAKFQYFKADYKKLLDEETPKVTEQEIKDYYETNKDRDYRKARLPEPAAGQNLEPNKDQGDATTPPADTKTPPANANNPEHTTPKADEKTSNSPAAPKTDATKGDTKNAAAPQSEGKAAPAGKKSSQFQHRSSLDGELLALADESQLNQNQTPPATKTSEAKASDTKTSDAKTAAASDTKTGNTKDSESPASTVPPVEYEPLEKVRDQIRDRVATQKVDARIEKAFAALMERMKKYSSDLGRYRVKLAPQPEPLDFAALAKEYGLEAKETDLISNRQAYDDTDIGRSNGPISYNTFRPARFIDVAFNTRPSQANFEPKESEDIDRNRYLWWKIAEEESSVPPLADIKPEVIHAWKMIEARKPAQAKADQYAEEVRKANLPMRDVLTGKEVITAGPFSWLSQSFGQQAPQISEVSGVKDIGDEFMRTVFSLDPKQTGVATNLPQNTFYVVQVESTEPPLEELQNGFMSAMANPMLAQTYAAIGLREHSGDISAWLKELENQFEVRLVRATPSAPTENPEE